MVGDASSAKRTTKHMRNPIISVPFHEETIVGETPQQFYDSNLIFDEKMEFSTFSHVTFTILEPGSCEAAGSSILIMSLELNSYIFHNIALFISFSEFLFKTRAFMRFTVFCQADVTDESEPPGGSTCPTLAPDTKRIISLTEYAS